jgi:hypothetical protein
VLKIRNADNDAWITIGTIDQTGDTFTLTSAVSATTLNTSGAVVFNDAGADVDFRVEGDTEPNLLFVDASADKVGIGTSSPGCRIDVVSPNNTTLNPTIRVNSNNVAVNSALAYDGLVGSGEFELRTSGASPLKFGTNGTERMRIDSSGSLIVGSNSPSFGDGVAKFWAYGTASAASFAAQSVGSVVGLINRETDDGVLFEFRQSNNTEGSISVLNNDVSYNPFLGSHAGALDDWSRSDIKVGTVMDTINELLEYKVVVIDVQEDIPAKDAVLDEEGNEIEPAQKATTQTVQKRISYNGNGAVGSTATVEYQGQEYTGVIEHERKIPSTFNKHLKVKINDTAASKTVFGVFVGWNNDPNNDGGVYNDMLVGAVGNYVIRMAAGQTPEAGDLVEADGNGCAVVQDDDIIRTKTIAKVTSTIPQVTYDDGSFLVTCVLYCG